MQKHNTILRMNKVMEASKPVVVDSDTAGAEHDVVDIDYGETQEW